MLFNYSVNHTVIIFIRKLITKYDYDLSFREVCGYETKLYTHIQNERRIG